MNLSDLYNLSISDAALILGVSPTTVRREIKRGNLGSYRIAGRRLIAEKQLFDYLEGRELKARLK